MENTNVLDFFDDDIEKARATELGNALELQKEEIDYKPSRLDTFREILPSLMSRKQHLLNDDNEKDYVSFLVNRMLSYHEDCIMQANEMNCNYRLESRLQYDYLFQSLRAKKRPWAKWIKPINDKDLAAVKLYFGYSKAKAMSALNILTEEQLVMIRQITTVDE